MQKNLTNSILNVCKILNENTVQYLIVGGTAVALHGYFRLSMNTAGLPVDKPDLDFWYNPTYDNYFKLLNALGTFGVDVKEFKEEQTPDPKNSFFRHDAEEFTLDFLPKIKASLNFRTCFQKREIVAVNEIEIPFLAYADLITDKKANARPKDLNDIEHLQKYKQNPDS